MRNLGALLEIPGQAGGHRSNLDQEKLQEARREWIGKRFLSETREGVMKWVVSRAKVQVWLGREETLLSLRWAAL